MTDRVKNNLAYNRVVIVLGDVVHVERRRNHLLPEFPHALLIRGALNKNPRELCLNPGRGLPGRNVTSQVLVEELSESAVRIPEFSDGVGAKTVNVGAVGREFRELLVDVATFQLLRRLDHVVQ